MKKSIFLLFILLSGFLVSEGSYAQCKPCPERFFLKDSACTNIQINGQSPQPFHPPVFIVSDSIRACEGSKVTYSISPNFGQCTYPGITYTYIISNGTLVNSGAGQFTIQWGSAGYGSVTISYTIPPGPGSEGCVGSFTVIAILSPSPVAAFTISPNPACLNNQPICFNASGSTGAVGYFWNFGDGFNGTGVNPCHTYANPGTYTVTLIVSGSPLGGGIGQPGPPCPSCVDSIKQTVTVYTLPGPPIESCSGSVCADGQGTYCTPVPPGCGAYVWTVTGGTITGGQGTPCITVQWGSGNPQGTVTLQITGCPTYCAQGTTINVPIIPATTTISGSTTACVNTSATYSLPVWPGSTYNWTLSGGGNIIGNNTNTPSIAINWTTPGSYTITCNYFDTSNECGGTGTTTVNVLPIAAITGNNSFCAGSSTTLSTVGFTSSWIISPAGASITPSGTSATVTSSNPGTYTVTATPASPLACNAPTYTVTVLPKPVLTGISGADSICKNQTYVYSVASNATGTFSWNVTNGSFVTLGTFSDSIQVTWNNSAGPFTISVSQTNALSGCVSDPVTFNAYAYPTPVISGTLNVCADAVVTYTVTNIGNQPFNWYVTPANLGTIISGQGSNTLQIKWHGSNNPGNTNTAYLHAAFCNDDSILITISEPVIPTITASGTLCGGGVNLSVAATGTFSWTCVEHPIVPTQATNLSSLTGLTLPGNYTVTISNYNGTGCTVSATYFVPDIGRPTASISANNLLNYCLPSLPNLNLVAAYSPGYQFQWFQAPATPIGSLTTNPVLPINFLTAAGSYTFYCVVTLNGCSVTSNVITITIQNCPGGGNLPPCNGILDITGVTGCNPFTLTLAAAAPSGGTIVPGTTTITYENLTVSSGNTTNSFDSVGYKQIRVCADIALPGGGTTRCCKDTVVLVTVASKFLANEVCGVVNLTDLSTVIFPATISSYVWSNGTNPGNAPVPTSVANFNNNTLQNPTDTFKVSGSYIITQTITSGSCTVSSSDTLSITLPNASFTASNSCVGTPINLSAVAGFTSYYWDFGDNATSYTQTTSHAYGATGNYTITLLVTDAKGCIDTASQTITISAAPACNITVTGPVSFCAGGSVVLQACAGFTGYQWFNNGAPIAAPAGIAQNYTATQTGNYSFTATDPNGCLVISDTISVNVDPAPAATIFTTGSKCLGGTFNFSVPACGSCSFFWTLNGNPIANISNSGTFTIGPSLIGTNTLTVTVTNNVTGCTATSSVTVTFYNPPTVSISVVPNTPGLCANSPYQLTATTSASSPVWAWNYNAINFVLSTTNTVTASTSGTYTVLVTDGVSGCIATASQIINPIPDLALFPAGCDTLCDTSSVFLPIGSINNNLSGYTITWYDNAPPYTNVVGTGPSISLASPLALGNHSLSVIVTGPNGCSDTSNNYNIFVEPCSGCNCEESNWGELSWTYAPLDDAPVDKSNIIITPPTIFNCGDDLGKIDCNKPIIISGSYNCNPSSCDSAVSYTLFGPVTASGNLPFSTAGLPAGNYTLVITGKCGDSICNECKIPFVIICETQGDCCKGSFWEKPLTWTEGETDAGGGTGPIVKPIICNESRFEISDAMGNCNKPITIIGSFVCQGECPPKVVFTLTDLNTNTVITSVTGSLTIPVSLPNGTYMVTVDAYCGDIKCDSCKFTFIKKCTLCDCHPGKPIEVMVTTNETSKKYNCGSKLPDIDCKSSVVLSGSYSCKPNNCPASFTYQLTGPSGTTTGVLPLTLNTLPPGNYTILLSAYCNNKLCNECQLTFTVKCKGIPPKECCPYQITAITSVPIYKMTPGNNATVMSQMFNFTGLTGVPLAQVKAQVLSYSLNSNYKNACLGCKSYPFTWASVQSAGNIGTVIPKISLFGGVTTPVFNPSGNGIYQNPREVIWNTGSSFVFAGPISMNFLLPPPSIIDCCILSGKICVKFTFTDTKCRECEVIACFDFQIIEDLKINYVSQ